jgi:hypothetical protein
MTPGPGKNMVEEAVQNPFYPSPGFMPGPQHFLIIKYQSGMLAIMAPIGFSSYCTLKLLSPRVTVQLQV